MRDIARSFAIAIDVPGTPDELDRLIHEYLHAWSRNVSPAPDALTSVEELQSTHRLTVVSNTHDSGLVPELMKRFGFDRHIELAIASVEVGWRKPHPEIYHHALAANGVRPEQAIFVGDNWIADVEGPRAVGIDSYYVGRPFEGRSTVSLAELPHLVRSRAAQ